MRYVRRAAPADSGDDPAERVVISVEGTYSQEWDDSEGHVSILRGHCRVKQGSTILEAQKMVLWRSTQTAGKGKRDRLTIYLEDDVRIEEPGSTLNDSPMIVTLSTRAGVHVHIVNSENARPGATMHSTCGPTSAAGTPPRGSSAPRRWWNRPTAAPSSAASSSCGRRPTFGEFISARAAAPISP